MEKSFSDENLMSDGLATWQSTHRCACDVMKPPFGEAEITIIRANGDKEYLGKFSNARVSQGATSQFANLFTGTQLSQFTYIALASSAITLSNSDTGASGMGGSSTSELSVSGLARTLVTPTYGSQSTLGGNFTCTFGPTTFTNSSGSSQTVQGLGLFNSATHGSGQLFSEVTFTLATLQNGDQIAATYVITM
jgi:hypothetical protein